MLRYSKQLLRYFYSTPHQGLLDAAKAGVKTARVGTPDNQDVLTLSCEMQQNKILKARFLATGSVAIIAGGEWLCDYMEGQDKQQLSTLTVSAILQHLELPDVKVHIAGLLLQAMKTCMDTSCEKNN